MLAVEGEEEGGRGGVVEGRGDEAEGDAGEGDWGGGGHDGGRRLAWQVSPGVKKILRFGLLTQF